jgi:hypothetical protein
MRSRFTLIVVALVCFNLAACGNNEEAAKAPAVEIHDGYSATLAEGIQFAAKQNYPSFIKSVTGMSGYESLGRWSEGKIVIFTLTQNLPTTFTIDLELAGAFGPNANQLVKVRVGDWEQMFPVNGFSVDAKPITEKFHVKSNTLTDSIEFTIPDPKSPKESGVSSDTRQLGIMFRRLSITKD